MKGHFLRSGRKFVVLLGFSALVTVTAGCDNLRLAKDTTRRADIFVKDEKFHQVTEENKLTSDTAYIWSGAIHHSLEVSPDMEEIRWRNKHAQGQVTPVRSYYGSQKILCREFISHFTYQKNKQTFAGVACRNNEGWRLRLFEEVDATGEREPS